MSFLILICFFFRCFLLLWSRCNLFFPSHEPLCWKSGRWCVTIHLLSSDVKRDIQLGIVVQENLMKARDERVALMNEVRLAFFYFSFSHNGEMNFFCLALIDLGWDPYAQSMSNSFC